MDTKVRKREMKKIGKAIHNARTTLMPPLPKSHKDIIKQLTDIDYNFLTNRKEKFVYTDKASGIVIVDMYD